MSTEIKAFLSEKRRLAVRSQKVDRTPKESPQYSRAAASPSPPPSDPNVRGTPRQLPSPTPTPIAARSTPTTATLRSMAGRKQQQKVVSQSPVPAFTQPNESTTPAGVVNSRFGSVVAAIRPMDASLTSAPSAQLLLSESQIRVAKADAVWESLRGMEEAVRFRETGVDLTNSADPFSTPVDDRGPLPGTCSELLSICTNMLVVATTYRDEEEHSKAEIVASHTELLTRWPFNSRRRHSYEDWLVFGTPPKDAQERAEVEGERVRLHHESLLTIALCSSKLSRWGDALGAMRECISNYVHNRLHTQLAPSPAEEALSLMAAYFPKLKSTSSSYDVPVDLLLNYISLLTLAIEGGHYVTGPAAPMHDGHHYILSDTSVAGEVGADTKGVDAARSEILRTASMVAARCGSKLEVLRDKEAVSTLMIKGCIEARDAYTNCRALLASQLCAARIHIAEVLQDELQNQYDGVDITTSSSSSVSSMGGDLLHSKGLFKAVSTTLLLSSTQRLMLEELGAAYPLYPYLLGLISTWSHWLSSSPVTLNETAEVGESTKSQRWRVQVGAARKCASSLFNKKASYLSYESTLVPTDAISLASSVAPYRLGLLLLSQCKRLPNKKAAATTTTTHTGASGTVDGGSVSAVSVLPNETADTSPMMPVVVSPTSAPPRQDALSSPQPTLRLMSKAPTSPMNVSMATSRRRSSAVDNSPRHKGTDTSDGRPPWKGSGAVVRRQPTDLPEIESCTEVQSVGRRSRSASPSGAVHKVPSPTTTSRRGRDVPTTSKGLSSPPDTILVITSGSIVQPVSVRPVGDGKPSYAAPSSASSSRRLPLTTASASPTYTDRHRWAPEDDDDTTASLPQSSRSQQQQPPMQLRGSTPPPHSRRHRSPGSTRSSIPLRDPSGGPSPVANIYGFAESSAHMRRPMGDQLDTVGHHPLHVVDPPNGRGSPDAPKRKASKGHIWPLN